MTTWREYCLICSVVAIAILILPCAWAEDPAPASAPATSAVGDNRTPVNTEPVNFNREIRPILSNNCFACHGPDETKRKAGLRFDDGDSAFKTLSSGHIPIVPGDRAKGELFRRITTADAEDKMPPARFGKTLTSRQVDLLGRWIDSGAKFEKHWAFTAPKRPDPPAVANKDWSKNDLDRFVLARLEKEGLTPSPEADRATLVRRVTLDLTGLPPTLAEVDAFAKDSSPDAYEKLVDRLLAKPQYGEQMARYWLDLARYSDTNGYHIDNGRYMWPWRDWVIGAFNRNVPYNEFAIEQLAGDLLPNPSLEQQIATGFNRNHMISFEGGIIPEEYRVQYVVDRVNTTSTVFMGLTMGCCQCHDHKFDPLTQRDYYQMFSFFNTIDEKGSDGAKGNADPVIKAPTHEQSAKLAELDKQVKDVLDHMNRPIPEVDAAQAMWEEELRAALPGRWTVLGPGEMKSTGGATLTARPDQSVFVEGANPDKDAYEISVRTGLTNITAIRLEAIPDDALPLKGAGRSDNANFVLTEFEADAAPSNSKDAAAKIVFAVADADYAQTEFGVENAIDGKPETGWGVLGGPKMGNRTAVFVPTTSIGYPGGTLFRVRLHFESQFAKHAIGHFRLSVTTDPAMASSIFDPWFINGPYTAPDGKTAYDTGYDPEKNVNLEETYEDHRLKWLPQPDLADGEVHKLVGGVAATYLYRVIHAPSARVMTLSVGSNDAVKVWLNGQVFHDNNVQRDVKPDQDRVTLQLAKGDNRLLMKVVNYGAGYAFAFRRATEQAGDIPLGLEPILAAAKDQRTEEQSARIREFYRGAHSPVWKEESGQLAKAKKARDDFDAQIPTTMVMREMANPRDTFILKRGQYDQPQEKVQRGTPAALPPLPANAPLNRLGLAQWLVDPAHPLTARVAVNRFWMWYFGTGIVKTAEDFGVQGQAPSNQELLDWLATEFIRTGWDVKAMQKLIVTSATYRQKSQGTPELYKKDPENVLLARGPRFRMDAEMVRDSALAISGLLAPAIGGPSVKPYQPDLWKEVSYGGKGTEFSAQEFVQDHGESLYRRSMYIFWKRQSPPPGMATFDGPAREVCTARRARTNTPLQALEMLNDPQYVEAARALAQRVMKEGPADAAQRMAYTFELATARKPTETECSVLLDVLNKNLEEYKKNAESAKQLLSIGELPRDEKLDQSELAAWTTVASVILNLDETISKS